MKKEVRNKSIFISGILVVVIIITIVVGLFVFSNKSKKQVADSINNISSLVREQLVQQIRPVFASNNKKTEEANTKIVNIEAAPTEVSLIDGTTTKIWGYNGTVPGPEIRLTLGDKLKINFTNNLPQDTTIHFHGIRLPNEMDGVPGVTQDPIAPGDSFVYEFTPSDAGTYWYHPHVRGAEQVERGLYGVIIVEDLDKPKVLQDKVMVLDDWKLMEDAEIYPKFVTGHDISHDGRWGNVITVNGKKDNRLQASPGETVLLRFVNTANARIFMLDFANLDTRAIAYDGITARKAFNPKSIELSPGNRMDVLVTIPEDSSLGEVFFVKDIFTRRVNNLFEIEVINGGKQGININEYLDTISFNSNLPDWSDAFSLNPDVTYRLNARRGGMHGISWTINNKAFPDIEKITLKKDSFSKIRFINQSSRLHPMHLHGQFFKVLARDGVPVDEPFMRDTVLIYGKETVDIGIVPFDAGVWANHCHILEHAEAGMMTLFEVK